MADDIKIRIGVESNVKSDLDALKRELGLGIKSIQAQSGGGTLESMVGRAKSADIKRRDAEILAGLKDSLEVQKAEYRKHAEELSKIYGSGGVQAGGAFTRGATGKSFRSAMIHAMRGDFSAIGASLEEMATGIGAKVAGALTAGLAGFKLGRVIDAKLGISDRLAKMFTAGQDDTGDVLEMSLRNLRRQNEMRIDKEAKREKQRAIQETIAGLRRQSKRLFVSEMGAAQDTLSEERDKLNSMKRTLDGSVDAKAILEQQLRVDQALVRLTQLDIQARENIGRDLANERKAEDRDYEEGQKAADTAINDAAKQRDADAKASQKAAIDAIQQEIDNERNKANAIEGKLGELEKAKNDAEELLDLAMNPQGWRAAQKGERDKDRALRRQIKVGEQIDGMLRRGVKLPPRLQAIADAEAAAGAARRGLAAEKKKEAASEDTLKLLLQSMKDVRTDLDNLLVLKGN